MKSIALASSLALAASLVSAAAGAQTGRPSEVPNSIARSAIVIDTSQDPVGSYGHYLMLNGATRDVAIRAAQDIDHPAPRQFAWGHPRENDAVPATTPTRPQPQPQPQ